MGIGYAFGCLFSLLFWKLDKQNFFRALNLIVEKRIKYKLLIRLVYMIIITIIYYFLVTLILKDNFVTELYNGITAFLVIDISNTERKNLNRKEKVYFYNSISSISKALVCGFVAPLFYILLFGNSFGILYMLIYNLASLEKMGFLNVVLNLLNVIPSSITEVFLYIIYVYKNKSFTFNLVSDYRENSFLRPLLNVDVMAAYIEGVNFYYYYQKDYINYMKCYGKSNNKIDDRCIKNYLCIEYAICIIIFILFYIIVSIR